MRKRILAFDITRAMTIFLVIVGHSMNGWDHPLLSNLIFAINLPVFFFISGYFYRYKSISQTIKTGFNNLILPYFVVATLIVGLNFLKESLHHQAWNWGLLVPYFYGNGASVTTPGNYDIVPHMGAIWFLLMMFLANIIFQLLMRLKSPVSQVIGVLIAVLLGIWVANRFALPWTLQSALEVQIYYLAGYWTHRMNLIETHHWQRPIIGLSVILLGLTTVFGGKYTLVTGQTAHQGLSILAGIGSSFLLIYLAQALEKLLAPKSLAYLAQLGAISMLVLCIHDLDIIFLDQYLVNHFLSPLQGWLQSGAYLSLMIIRVCYTSVLALIIVKIPWVQRIFIERDYPLALT
ncbi:acyltransferase family protein [Weissella kandleri]|uniref:acyltransferase family protein n=1 Tax=Weissella kandleri TaxID=1616 RepID=UPI00387E8A46